MSDALSIAVNGLNSAVSRVAQSVSNIVNASSTGGNNGANLDSDLINTKVASTDYAANAAVIKAVEKDNKALLDIKV